MKIRDILQLGIDLIIVNKYVKLKAGLLLNFICFLTSMIHALIKIVLFYRHILISKHVLWEISS